MSYSSEVLTRSPSLYWRLGEASGTTVVDSSGNGRNGAYAGSYTLGVPGLLVSDADTAVNFNGAEAKIAHGAWMNTDYFTAIAWVSFDGDPTTLWIVGHDVNGGGGDLAWRVDVDAGLFRAIVNVGGAYQIISAPAPDPVADGIYQVATTYDGITVRLYVNGVQRNSVAYAGVLSKPAAAPIVVGRSGGGSLGFDGEIDEVSVYPVALSAADILEDYNNGLGDFPVAAVEVTLAGQSQRRTGAFDLHLPTHVTLAGESQRRVGAFEVKVPIQGTLTGSTARRVGTFTARVDIPVVPAPVPAVGHAELVARAFGPVTIQGSRAVYAISSASIPRARQRILVDGIDVTYFRDVTTPDVPYTLLEPLLYGPATLDLPQVSACFERTGVGALSWLREDAPVEVQLVLDDVVIDTLWRGLIVAFNTSGRFLSVECGGDANGRAASRNRQVPIFPRVNDLGRQVADAVRDLGLPFEPRLGPVTGIEVMTTGGTGHLEHIEALVAKGWTRAGRQWTVMPDPATGVYEMHRKNDTTIDGTVFIDDTKTVANLRRDTAEEPNRIFVTCVTPTGMRIRFGVYPGLKQGPVPDFPGHMQMGDTGEGVRLLILKLQAMGYLKLEDTAGGYDQDVYDAVLDLQNDAGLFNDGFSGTASPGEVNLTTWEALYDVNVTGLSAETAHIEPAAQRSKVKQWNRSASGNIMGANPNHDASISVRDRNIDLGPGYTRSQAREIARTILHDSDTPNWVGTITFHTGALIKGDGFEGMAVAAANVMDARLLRPGMNVDLPQFDGGTLFHIAACEVDAQGLVTITVDTRFRDAMEVWEIIARNKESRNDPARGRNRKHRSSTILKDSIGEWDEIGGLLGNDITLAPGWTVFPVVAAMEGVIARLRIHTSPPAEFVTAVFGENIGPGTLMALIGDPLTKAGTKKWTKESVRNELDNTYELLYVAGDYAHACGYWPKKQGQRNDEETAAADLTGKWDDKAGFRYRSRVKHMVWVAVWSDRQSKIEAGRIMWPQLEAAV